MIWDHLTSPSAEIGEVPWSVEALTPAWLTDVLCVGVGGATVEDFSVGAADTGSTVRRSVAVRYNDVGRSAGLPEALFARASPGVLNRLSTWMGGIPEVRFYREVRPALDVEAPVSRYSGADPASGRSFHLMEDLVVGKGATFLMPSAHVSRAEAEQVVDLLADLHGPHFGDARLWGEGGWLPHYETFMQAMVRLGVRDGHEGARDLAVDVIPPIVRERWGEIWAQTDKAVAAHASAPRTFLHSDVHLGNWYRTSQGRMGLADWGDICAGHWARDVAYAVATTLAAGDRREWELDLLRRYLDRLRDRFDVRISFDDAWQAYRLQLFTALLMWTPTLVHPPSMPDMQPQDMSLLMIERLTAAIADTGALDA
ncbi:phosphotransferase [Georgenia sp. SYP-B2076]|uniref:phosphotransferase n=1 Tax=Georgenia sp. SYP-B2076 TaxID=2495881 RepID=UPI000F8C61D4|nr:phosphotransferase [Georgenia sp. SYP-B2076]